MTVFNIIEKNDKFNFSQKYEHNALNVDSTGRSY